MLFSSMFSYSPMVFNFRAHSANSASLSPAGTSLQEHLLEELEGAWVVGLSEPEHGLPAHVGTGIVVRHANHLLEGTWFVADGQRKRHMRAHIGTGIVLGHALQSFQPLFSPRRTEPEGRLPA